MINTFIQLKLVSLYVDSGITDTEQLSLLLINVGVSQLLEERGVLFSDNEVLAFESINKSSQFFEKLELSGKFLALPFHRLHR